VWLRSLCPDEYDRGDVIARGSVSSFPDVFSVSVSGEGGEFTSTLTIDKPRTQMGSGVFRYNINILRHILLLLGDE